MGGGRRQIDERLAGAVSPREAFLNVVSAGRRIRRQYDGALESYGLTLDQCRILEALRHAGPEGLEAEDFNAVLRRMCVDARCEAKLENEGWLERDHEGDRRITGPGRERLADLDPVLEEVDDRLAEALGAREVAELKDILAKVLD